MFKIDWKIQFEAQASKKVYNLGVLNFCEVIHDEEQLSDTARITLPASAYNKTLNIDDKIQRGDKVLIWFGYDGKLVREFTGFIKEINTNDSSLNIECEDEIFVFRKKVKDRILKKVTIKAIAESIISELGLDLTVVSNATILYDDFAIRAASGYDVIKKIQEETKLDIYIKDKVLYMSAMYLHKTGEVIFDFSKNVEKGDLTYKSADDRKVEVEVTYTDKAGKVHKYTAGTTGGTKIEKKAQTSDLKSLQQLANQELVKNSFDGYEGSITSWLIPYVETGYTAQIIDNDYPLKNGSYYVRKVTVSVGDQGGVRQSELGIKLSK